MAKEYHLQRNITRQDVELRIDYRGELNDQQHAAVTSPKGPSLVIAGAGAGKTRTLTYRVAYLLEQGIPADRILLLTFTNKAAREMMQRVGDLLGNEASVVWGGTFHSIGARMLRRHGTCLGFGQDFSIMNREDAVDLLSTCVAVSGIDVKATRFPKPKVLADIFSLVANKQSTMEILLEKQFPYFAHLTREMEQVMELYRERKQTNNMMDFDDLLGLWLVMLRQNSEILEQYQQQFQFVLVDEYQDTNRIQSNLVDLIGARHQNVMVVGDDSQSIYSWRGAHFANIFEFPKRYADAIVHKIETNYRSTPQILNFANAVIQSNAQQFSKQLEPARPAGQKPMVIVTNDAHEQAMFVAQKALELRDEGIELDEMAILYRSHFHAMELQMELTSRNIPFSITSGIRFFEQAHIKDVTASIKLMTNPADELSFKRVVKLMPGIGARTADTLWHLFQGGLANTPSTGNADTLPPRSLMPGIQGCIPKVPKKSGEAWTQFQATMEQMEAPKIRGSTAAMIRHIMDAGYEDYLKSEYSNFRNRMEDLEQLAVYSQQFETPETFLTQLALETDLAPGRKQEMSQDEERIRLSTIHQAKGLEFKVVFVIMLCEGLFPSERSTENPDSEEEERRLFYVASTRAMDELYLCYPLMRFSQRGTGDFMQTPSRFLAELPRDVFEEVKVR
ncbi:MAG: UvrD-helicase domain-containing protein [Verrucomicrobiota bacterium]|nr:UvrD-helicase domain-containing protein [Verrucomicrobiota bacterium]